MSKNPDASENVQFTDITPLIMFFSTDESHTLPWPMEKIETIGHNCDPFYKDINRCRFFLQNAEQILTR
jgi:hypothetical protein